MSKMKSPIQRKSLIIPECHFADQILVLIEVLEEEVKEAEEGQSNEILKLNFLSKGEEIPLITVAN